MEKVILDDETHWVKTTFDLSNTQLESIKLCERIVETSPVSLTDAYAYKKNIDLNKKWIEYKMDTIIDLAISKCTELYEEKNVNFNHLYIDTWVNIVRAGKPKQANFKVKNEIQFHSHVELNEAQQVFRPDYTFVIYLQMPDNLNGDDGVLFVKGLEDKIYSYLPKEGEIVIMDGNVYHVPNSAPNSTKDRVVVAGNVGFTFDKQTKSLI